MPVPGGARVQKTLFHRKMNGLNCEFHQFIYMNGRILNAGTGRLVALTALTQSFRVAFQAGKVPPIKIASITVDQAKTLLPPRYTGFIASSHAYYAPIEKAGIAVGKIKAK